MSFSWTSPRLPEKTQRMFAWPRVLSRSKQSEQSELEYIHRCFQATIVFTPPSGSLPPGQKRSRDDYCATQCLYTPGFVSISEVPSIPHNHHPGLADPKCFRLVLQWVVTLSNLFLCSELTYHCSTSYDTSQLEKRKRVRIVPLFPWVKDVHYLLHSTW